jgi:hypothetical protein
MSKPATLIVWPRYSYRKQIKKDYEVQFLTDLMLNDKTKKKNSIKKYHKNNLSQLISGSWG